MSLKNDQSTHKTWTDLIECKRERFGSIIIQEDGRSKVSSGLCMIKPPDSFSQSSKYWPCRVFSANEASLHEEHVKRSGNPYRDERVLVYFFGYPRAWGSNKYTTSKVPGFLYPVEVNCHASKGLVLPDGDTAYQVIEDRFLQGENGIRWIQGLIFALALEKFFLNAKLAKSEIDPEDQNIAKISPHHLQIAEYPTKVLQALSNNWIQSFFANKRHQLDKKCCCFLVDKLVQAMESVHKSQNLSFGFSPGSPAPSTKVSPIYVTSDEESIQDDDEEFTRKSAQKNTGRKLRQKNRSFHGIRKEVLEEDQRQDIPRTPTKRKRQTKSLLSGEDITPDEFSPPNANKKASDLKISRPRKSPRNLTKNTRANVEVLKTDFSDLLHAEHPDLFQFNKVDKDSQPDEYGKISDTSDIMSEEKDSLTSAEHRRRTSSRLRQKLAANSSGGPALIISEQDHKTGSNSISPKGSESVCHTGDLNSSEVGTEVVALKALADFVTANSAGIECEPESLASKYFPTSGESKEGIKSSSKLSLRRKRRPLQEAMSDIHPLSLLTKPQSPDKEISLSLRDDASVATISSGDAEITMEGQAEAVTPNAVQSGEQGNQSGAAKRKRGRPSRLENSPSKSSSSVSGKQEIQSGATKQKRGRPSKLPNSPINSRNSLKGKRNSLGRNRGSGSNNPIKPVLSALRGEKPKDQLLGSRAVRENKGCSWIQKKIFSLSSQIRQVQCRLEMLPEAELDTEHEKELLALKRAMEEKLMRHKQNEEKKKKADEAKRKRFQEAELKKDKEKQAQAQPNSTQLVTVQKLLEELNGQSIRSQIRAGLMQSDLKVLNNCLELYPQTASMLEDDREEVNKLLRRLNVRLRVFINAKRKDLQITLASRKAKEESLAAYVQKNRSFATSNQNQLEEAERSLKLAKEQLSKDKKSESLQSIVKHYESYSKSKSDLHEYHCAEIERCTTEHQSILNGMGTIEQQLLSLNTAEMEWQLYKERVHKRFGGQLGTLLLSDPKCLAHRGMLQELPSRLGWIEKVVKDLNISHFKKVDSQMLEYVQNSEFLFHVHSAEYLRRLKQASTQAKQTGKAVPLDATDKDTMVGPQSWDAATTAVALVLQATRKVLTGEGRNAFCAVRPPGHHAGIKLSKDGNGFCLLNNAASGAIYALKEELAEKVVIFDFDVHHGNGTQEIVAQLKRDDILFISLHVIGENKEVFPGTGFDNPHGNVLNITLQKGFSYEEIEWNLIQQKIECFGPDFFVLSSGFDAHRKDPMKLGKLTEENFGLITNHIAQLADSLADKAIVSVFEGGYGTGSALPSSIKAHIAALEEQTTGVLSL